MDNTPTVNDLIRSCYKQVMAENLGEFGHHFTSSGNRIHDPGFLNIQELVQHPRDCSKQVHYTIVPLLNMDTDTRLETLYPQCYTVWLQCDINHCGDDQLTFTGC